MWWTLKTEERSNTSTIICSDLHLTEAPLDEYKWGLFDFLRKKVLELDVDIILCLGDLCDRRDHHPSTLVNRLIDNLEDLSLYTDVVILAGNHDSQDRNNPFFRFSSKVGVGKIEFVYENTLFYLPITHSKRKVPCWFLPSTSNPIEDWKHIDFNQAKYILVHQTFSGAIAENGQTLTGCPPSIFDGFNGVVISGDIHKPQQLKHNITYVGSSYHCHFGDNFIPRCIHINHKGLWEDLYYPTLSKHSLTIRSFEELLEKEVQEGDQVKIKVLLPRSEYPMWPELRKKISTYMQEKGWVNCGIETQSLPVNTKEKQDHTPTDKTVDPITLVQTYAKKHKLDKESTEIGLSLIKESMEESK